MTNHRSREKSFHCLQMCLLSFENMSSSLKTLLKICVLRVENSFENMSWKLFLLETQLKICVPLIENSSDKEFWEWAVHWHKIWDHKYSTSMSIVTSQCHRRISTSKPNSFSNSNISLKFSTNQCQLSDHRRISAGKQNGFSNCKISLKSRMRQKIELIKN